MTTPSSDIEQELAAIKALVDALSPLSADARQRAVEYALRKLDIQLNSRRSSIAPVPSMSDTEPPRPVLASDTFPTDIRLFTAEKSPRSAIEMAALVTFYLSEVAPADERKASVTTDDLRKYFKQANFPLPGAIQYTLGNAAAAGFFESASRGEYKLTAIGHNLVAHGLPASDDGPSRARRSARRGSKKAAVTKGEANTATAKKVGPAKKAAPKKPAPTESRSKKIAGRKAIAEKR